MKKIRIYTREDAVEDGVLIRLQDYVQIELEEDEEATEIAIVSISQDPKCKFQLGKIFITPRAAMQIDVADVLNCLARHQRGDWGTCCPIDRTLNETAVARGKGRLFSVYRAPNRDEDNNVRFYVITEWNRKATTVLLPEEY